MSVNSWKLEKGLCRCCHAEGAFKSLCEPSYNLGQVEIFSDMLRQCLDIEVQPVEGVYSESTFTICDACAHRLRDASNFKQQVLQCEERFRDMYKNVKALGNVHVKQETETCAIEYELKEEHSDDDDDAVEMDFGQDADEDDNKTVLQLLLEGKKEKGKGKAKPKPKPKAKKAVPRPARAPKPKPAKPKKVEKKEDESTPKKDDDLPFTITISTDGNEDFNCKACGKTFKNRRYISQHYSHVHLKKRPKFTTCPMCGEKYTQSTRSAHMESAHGVPAPQCNVCNTKFSKPAQALAHQKTCHTSEKPYTITIATDGNKDFSCKTCGKTFKNRHNFSQHYSHVHLKKRPKFRTCHMCDEKFTSLSRAAHMESAHGIPAPQCNACNKKFSHPFQVLAHQKTHHMGEKAHSCSVCDKKFESATRVRKHFRSHLPTKSFKCDICDKSYRWSNNLTRHLETHLDVRKHVCLVCSEKFAQKSSLNYHMTKRHPELY